MGIGMGNLYPHPDAIPLPVHGRPLNAIASRKSEFALRDFTCFKQVKSRSTQTAKPTRQKTISGTAAPTNSTEDVVDVDS